MTQTQLLELAKQGRPKAIAALINQSLQPKGITAKASFKEGCLRIMLEARQVPNKKVLADFIYQGVMKLGSESITSLKVYGLQTGNTAPVWTQEFKLSGSPSLAATPPMAAPPASDDDSSRQTRESGNKRLSSSGKQGENFLFKGNKKENQSVKKRKPKTLSNANFQEVADSPQENSELPSVTTPEEYEAAIAEIGRFPRKGKFGLDYYYSIPKLANVLVDFVPAYGEIIDIVGVRYQGELACLLLTEQAIGCFMFPDFSRKATKGFILKFNTIAKILTCWGGLRIYGKKGSEFRVYFTDKKLGRDFVQSRISDLVPIEKGRFMPVDKYENILTLVGYMTLLLTIGVNVLALFAGVMFLLQKLIGHSI